MRNFYPCPMALALLGFVFAGAPLPAQQGPNLNVRLLTLEGLYVDHAGGGEFNLFGLFLGNLDRPKSFPDLCRQLDSWAKDIDVDHVVVDLTGDTLMLNLAQASELFRHLQRLDTAGKRTFAWIGNATPISYLVASGCDQILMTDLSALDFASLSLTVLHFHDLLKSIGAEASVVRAGDFKGAVEPFTRGEMSPELAAHYREMLRAMNEGLVARIAQSRQLTVEAVREAQSARLFTASQAKARGLVDLVIATGQERETVARLLDHSVRWVEPAPAKASKPLSFFDLVGKLLASPSRAPARQPSLAVLHLDGPIMDSGGAFPGVVTPAQIAEAVDALEADAAIRGVVVRVNSPGGSASASEAIRRSLERLARAKPLNFSFGDIAASGGYWVSCVSRPIYAEASTLTGSIGVFALKLSAGDLLDKAGLNLATVSLDESAEAFSIKRPWTPAEENQVQSLVDEIYTRFVELVARSRSLTRDQVEPLAGGRVWSGAQAAELKLVDKLGGLESALAALAQEAKLEEDCPVLHWPERKSLIETLDLFGVVPADPVPAAWSEFLPAQIKRRLPWPVIRAAVEGGAPRVWLLLPSQFDVR